MYAEAAGQGSWGCVLHLCEPTLHHLGWGERTALVIKIKKTPTLEYENGGCRKALFRGGICSHSGLRCEKESVVCYRGVWKDILCCSGDFLAPWCLLQANCWQVFLPAPAERRRRLEEQFRDHFPHPKQARLIVCCGTTMGSVQGDVFWLRWLCDIEFSPWWVCPAAAPEYFFCPDLFEVALWSCTSI